MRAGLAASVVAALLALGLGGIAGGGAPSPLRGDPNLMTYITWTSPVDGEQNVPVDAPIMVGLRDLNPTDSFQFTIVPAVSGIYIVVQWDANDVVLVVLHDSFVPCTDYTVGLMSPNLDPGPVPNPWSFTTECAFVPAQNLTVERL